MDMMFEKTRRWSIMCCKSGKGACSACGRRNVVAFVTKGYQYNRGLKTHFSNSNIKMCPFSFSLNGAEFRQGWTMFHEMIHIVSKVGDKGYSKKECFNNAKNDPARARENAAAYVYFAQNTGLPKADYQRYVNRNDSDPEIYAAADEATKAAIKI